MYLTRPSFRRTLYPRSSIGARARNFSSYERPEHFEIFRHYEVEGSFADDFLHIVAQEIPGPGTGVGNPEVPVNFPDHVVDVLDQGAVLLLAVPQGVLGFLCRVISRTRSMTPVTLP